MRFLKKNQGGDKNPEGDQNKERDHSRTVKN